MLHINKPVPKFSPMAIDIETSGLDPYQDRMLSVAVSDGTDTWILLNFYGFEGIKELLEDPTIVKIAHNAKFEHTWFKQCLGADTVNWYDTFLVEKVITKDDNLPMSLDEVLARYGLVLMSKEVRETFENHPGFAVQPVTSEQIEYMQNDVLYLGTLLEQQMVHVQQLDLQRTVDLEHSIVPAIAELELNGVRLDWDLWFQQKAEFEVLSEQADKRMRELIGEDYILQVPAKKKGVEYIKDIPCNEINLNSPIQLKEVLNSRFKFGADTTNAAMLEEIHEQWTASQDLPEFCGELLKYRGYKKRIGYAYEQYIHPLTGKVHPSYHQLGARTGRFSCSNPNLQQVPRPIKGEPNMRNIWLADNEDFVIIRADYSQQEPRVMAQLCGDPAMIEACNKEDVYIEFGRHIFGYEIEKGSEERYISKQFVLATGYGAGGEKLSKASGKDLQTCIDIRQKIRDTFPIMAAFGQKMYTRLLSFGYVETAIGRRRYLDDSFTQAVNTPVQGTAADMFKLSLAKIHKALTELKKCGKINDSTRVWNLVHDEIEVHCHKDEVEIVLPLVKELMEEAGREICPDVLHVAEADYGYRWDK